MEQDERALGLSMKGIGRQQGLSDDSNGMEWTVMTKVVGNICNSMAITGKAFDMIL